LNDQLALSATYFRLKSLQKSMNLLAEYLFIGESSKIRGYARSKLPREILSFWTPFSKDVVI